MSTITIQVEAPNVVPYSSTEWNSLMKTLNDFVAVIPLTSLALTSTAKDNAEKLLTPPYLYQFTSLDGRSWSQTVAFMDNISGEPSVTFAVTSAWKTSECALAADLFNAIIAIIQKFGVTAFSVNWS